MHQLQGLQHPGDVKVSKGGTIMFPIQLPGQAEQWRLPAKKALQRSKAHFDEGNVKLAIQSCEPYARKHHLYHFNSQSIGLLKSLLKHLTLCLLYDGDYLMALGWSDVCIRMVQDYDSQETDSFRSRFLLARELAALERRSALPKKYRYTDQKCRPKIAPGRTVFDMWQKAVGQNDIPQQKASLNYLVFNESRRDPFAKLLKAYKKQIESKPRPLMWHEFKKVHPEEVECTKR